MILLKASFSIDIGNRPAVVAALKDLRSAALTVPGCRGFEILEEPHAPGTLTIVEEWSDEDAMKAHDGSDAVAAFWQGTSQLIVQQGPTRVIRLAGSQSVYGVAVTDEAAE